MFERVLFGRAKERHRHKGSPPRPRDPAWHFQFELGYQRLRRATPIRLVRQIHVDPRWDVLLHLVLEELLPRSEEHTSELQSQSNLVCRLLLEKKKTKSSW